jgi:transcriptional regulator with XRE-family HTH domain
MTFGAWLNDTIIDLGRTRGEVARRTGVSDETIRRWINDEDLPRGRHIVPLASALGVSPALVVSHFEGAPPLTGQEEFYASLPGDLTEEERKSIMAFIRARRMQG